MQSVNRLRELYDARRFEEAWALYTEGLGADAEWHLYGALTAWRRQQWFDARLAAELSLESEPDGPVRAKAHFIAGVVALEIGDRIAASRHLDACEAELDTLPDLRPILLGSVYFNQGLVLGGYDDRRPSIAAYEKALVEFRREGMHDNRRQCLQNLARMCCDAGELARAEEALLEAEDLCQTQDSRWRQSTVWAHLVAEQGHYREAMARCEALLRAEGVPPDLTTFVSAVAAEIAFAQGFLNEALQLAVAALERSFRPPINMRAMNRASAIYAKVRAEMKARSEAGA